MTSAIDLKRVPEIARRARASSRVLGTLPADTRNAILLTAANMLEQQSEDILSANMRDCATAQADLAAGRITSSLFDRLSTNEVGIADMAAKVRAVAELPDPLGRSLAVTNLAEDLTLQKVSCPLGVIGVVFESRPDVIPQVSSLCLKSGNAVLLKGGTEAQHTNEVLAGIWQKALTQFKGVPADAVSLLRTREDVTEMLEQRESIDLIIPRGSKAFVEHIFRRSLIPVLGHGEGVCHVYVDRAADLVKAWNIAFDAKTNYPAACNAAETLLVHEQIAPQFLPEMLQRFQEAGVEVRGCEQTRAVANSSAVVSATVEDWGKEYSDLIIAVKVVRNLDEAISHIDQYGSQHTESIITEDPAAADRFMELIDAAGIYHNASTRFADGFRYGLGAEIGISTSKLHARGPVGLEGLVTYKYKLFGNGHIVGSRIHR